jgi:penicillin-insensitive murein endopeptidase
MKASTLLLIAALTSATTPVAVAARSVCYGTPAAGSLRGGCQLPENGANFSAYSRRGVMAGRSYVHCTVREIVAAAYADVARQRPDVRFVYGESGFAGGGPFAPHKTHQNGLSIDFFVPVRDRAGRSVPLPTSAANRWGYDLELDARGRLGDLTIDFDAMAAHLLALHRAAAERHARIARVYFDTELQRLLRGTKAWPQLARAVPFSTRQGWWKHDEHYHVDFDLPCEKRQGQP